MPRNLRSCLHYGQGRTTEEACHETTNGDRVDILGYSNWNLGNAEDGYADEHGPLATIELAISLQSVLLICT